MSDAENKTKVTAIAESMTANILNGMSYDWVPRIGTRGFRTTIGDVCIDIFYTDEQVGRYVTMVVLDAKLFNEIGRSSGQWFELWDYASNNNRLPSRLLDAALKFIKGDIFVPQVLEGFELLHS